MTERTRSTRCPDYYERKASMTPRSTRVYMNNLYVAEWSVFPTGCIAQ
jgi:hypothetical protein